MKQKNKILIADDDGSIREVIHILLESEGFEIVEATNGKEAIELADNSFDLIILDVMMPECSGIEACTAIRRENYAPILFLTAKSTDVDKVMGFSAGGDDYLSKPFSYTELLSRVKALVRRYHQYNERDNSVENFITIQDIQINVDNHQVFKGENEILLTELEYQILLLLASNKKKIFSFQNIYEDVWNEPYYASSDNTVMVHIRNIRKKLEDDIQNPKYIMNIWGRGYRIV